MNNGDWIYDLSFPPSDEFAEWLTVRLDADYNCAAAAGHGDEAVSWVSRQPNAGWVSLDLTDNCRPTYDVQFARHHGPRRVMAEVEVKREILALHNRRGDYCHTCGGLWPCLTLRAIAAPYACESSRTTYRTVDGAVP